MTQFSVAINNTSFPCDPLPSVCPHCGYAIEPRYLNAISASTATQGEIRLEIAYLCVRTACQKMFIATFIGSSYDATQNHLPLRLRDVQPRTPQPPHMSAEVEGVSMQFTKVYRQAAAAESYSLDEIAGVGYRKALEFLIKDFCSAEHPDEADEIKRLPLAQVIGKYVADSNLKECARRATWLGNDEAHYERRWGDKDIRDLKTLIDLSMTWIRGIVLTARYLKDMPDAPAR